MSADNGVYIASFPNGNIRVAHAFESHISELENRNFYTVQEEREALESQFAGCPVFREESEALLEAGKILKDVGYTEYGISYISFSVDIDEPVLIKDVELERLIAEEEEMERRLSGEHVCCTCMDADTVKLDEVVKLLDELYAFTHRTDIPSWMKDTVFLQLVSQLQTQGLGAWHRFVKAEW